PESVSLSDRRLLYEAQVRKTDAILDRLSLKSDDHVLEIGCGWGFMAVRAVERFGCKWTGLTISKQQFEYAKRRVADKGFEKKVTIKFLDYR
ncbi:Protein F13D12.9, partial [Aphelenchoides avenae]